MKKIFCYSTVLLCLLVLLFVTGGISANAQMPPSGNSAKNSTVKNLWKLAAEKRSGKSFVVLTPADLAKLTATEKTSLMAFGDPCDTTTQINIGQTVGGTLSATDCQLEDGTYADFYIFQGNQGQTVDIRLNSSAFDAYLGLANDSGTFVLEDDDSGGGTNSRIVAKLPETGLYVILANSVFPEETGAYSLSLNEIINCTYSLSPTSADIPAAGGTFSITITTQNGCQWTARTNNEDFITVNTASGTGILIRSLRTAADFRAADFSSSTTI